MKQLLLFLALLLSSCSNDSIFHANAVIDKEGVIVMDTDFKITDRYIEAYNGKTNAYLHSWLIQHKVEVAANHDIGEGRVFWYLYRDMGNDGRKEYSFKAVRNTTDTKWLYLILYQNDKISAYFNELNDAQEFYNSLLHDKVQKYGINRT